MRAATDPNLIADMATTSYDSARRRTGKPFGDGRQIPEPPRNARTSPYDEAQRGDLLPIDSPPVTRYGRTGRTDLLIHGFPTLRTVSGKPICQIAGTFPRFWIPQS